MPDHDDALVADSTKSPTQTSFADGQVSASQAGGGATSTDVGTTTKTGGEASPQVSDTTTMTGLQFLQRGLNRPRTSGIGSLLGMTLTHAEHGQVEFQVTTQPDFANPLGAVHGGIAATMLDSAMGCAVHSTLEGGDWYTTLEIKINYIRAVGLDQQVLTARGKTVHVGRTTATAEGQLYDSQGRLVAHGTTTCLIRRG